MLSTASLPRQIPDIPALPIDFDDVSDRVKSLASEGQRKAMDLVAKTPIMATKKRSRFRLAWPVLAVLAGIGLYMAVRSRRAATTDVGQGQTSGAYARS